MNRPGSDLTPTLAWIAGGAASALAVGTAIECHQFAASAHPGASWVPSLIYGGVLWYWWAAVAVGLWTVSLWRPKLWVISVRNAVVQLAIAVIVAATHLEVLQATVRRMVAAWPYLGEIGYGQVVAFGTQRLSLEGLLYMILWATCAAMSMQLARQGEALQLAELKQQLSSAHLRALQMQLKPHFLFNTLNAITALVEIGRQEEAVRTLSHLNAILRSTLAQQLPEKVAVAEELAVVRNYLAIEQIRFSDRLRVEMRVDPAALDVGLRSTEDRLAHFYPGGYEFSSGELESGGFQVSIKIPYERSLA